MTDVSYGEGQHKKIEIVNRFEDEGDDVIYYYEKKHAVVPKGKQKKMNLDKEITIVITAMNKQEMCDTKLTYIDLNRIAAEYFDIKFKPKDDVVWIEKKKKIYIPRNVTNWTLTITYNNNAPLSPLYKDETHTVTIGEEKPGI